MSHYRMGGERVIHTFEMPVKRIGDDITINFVGDVHWGSESFAKKRFLRAAKEAEEKPRSWFFLMGDLMDMTKAGDRSILMRDMSDSTYRQAAGKAMKYVDEFCHHMVPILQGRTIGVLEGNHHFVFPDGRTCTQIIAERIGAKYLGCQTFTTLRFNYQGSMAAYRIHAAHDTGGGGTTTGRLAKMIRQSAFIVANLYAGAHGHKVGAIPEARVEQVGNELRHTDMHFIQTSSWQKQCDEGKNWMNERNMPPAAMRLPYVAITPRRDNHMTGRTKYYLEARVTV